MNNKNTLGHISAILTVLIWGTTFISTKVLLTHFTPIEILFFSFHSRICCSAYYIPTQTDSYR